MRIAKVLSVFACLALVVGSAMAQEQQQPGQGRRGGRGGFGGGFGGGGFGGFGGGFGGFGGGGLLQFANIEEVQKEIEALDEQVADLKKLSEEQQAAARAQRESAPREDIRSLSPEEQQKRFAEIGERMRKQTEETNAKVEEILLPNQVKRIKEIILQQQGIRALSNPEVIAELEITDDQKAQFEKVGQENREAMQKLGEEMQAAGESVDREAMGQKFQELRETNEKNMLAVLTDAQKSEFETMKGEKFDMPQRRGGFGGGGFGGGFGGGRRGGGRPDGGGGRPAAERPESDE
jgi:Spy/CpxP family protein refolding chaperone